LNLLLDTHIWLWVLTDPSRIPEDVLELISSPENDIYVSAISLWEVVIKSQLGKIIVQDDLIAATEAQEMKFLPFSADHAVAISELPLHHKDPFDRALIAQTLSHKLKLITADKAIHAYDDRIDALYVLQ
jgi:PIN domain nuclease of toxin-antitoxin system